jgi:hypothetical protein
MAAPPIVWTAPSLSRIGRNDAPGTSRTITIYAAKGESESFQIGVRGPASHVNVTATDFTLGSKAVIERSNITLYREHYITITNASSCPHPDEPCTNPPLGAGTYPDALIPFNDPQTGAPLAGAELTAVPFSVAAGENQPVWIDVTIPRGTVAGTYKAEFTIASDQGSASVDAKLVVWNFELPLQPALKSAFLIEHPTRAVQEELLRHRLMPKDVAPADEAELVARFGLNIASFPCWGGWNPKTNAPFSADDYRNEAAKHTQGLPLICYPADEISGATERYAQVKQWAFAMHQAGIKNLITMQPDPALYDDGSGTGRSAVDIWVMLPFQYDQAADRVRDVQAKGDEVWSYNTLVQDNYSPKWHIDFAPINFRIQPGFISQSLHLSGLLYWRIDWAARADGQPSDPWRDGYGMFYPGDGRMTYPGDEVGLTGGGVAPSMRLKWLRDGVDDFDYVDLLKKAGCGDAALKVARSVGQDWHTWTRDPATLEAARIRLGNALSRGADPSRCASLNGGD